MVNVEEEGTLKPDDSNYCIQSLSYTSVT